MKLLLVAAAASCIMAPALPSRADEITVTASAGTWEKALRACYAEPFTKRTGITVNVLPGTQVQWVNQIAASPAKPPIDVITNTMDSGYHAIELGLVDRMTEADAPNLKDINPAFVAAGRGYGTLLNFGAFGLAYNATTTQKRPQSWKGFVEGTVPGDWKAALPSINVPAVPMTTTWLFEHVYGGGTGNIQPGLDQIKRMKDSGHVVFYRNVNEFLAMMKNGGADIGMNVTYSPEVAPRIPTMKDIIVPPYDEIWTTAPSWIDQWNRQIGR